ncbi:hypothetical protein Tco_0974643 [Tanacetum coccineum]|uniref:Maturase K n=1 Tax=Tanacetum coccineum TaxID=301880 RepID=A0ABQ5ECA3_9ASTR
MIWITASKRYSITFAVLVISASLERLFVVSWLSHKSTSSLEELLEISNCHSSSLPKVEHSSSLDSFLSFKARYFSSLFSSDILRIFLDDHLVNFEVPDEFIK